MRGWMRFVTLSLVLGCGSTDTTGGQDGAGGLVNGGGGSGAWTTTTTTTTTGSSSSTSSTGSGSGGTGGAGGACVDLGLGESNQSEDTAFKLKAQAISDCDGNGDQVSGTIAGANDIDWFYYEGDDQSGCIVDPTRDLSTDVSGLRLCAFFECLHGDTLLTCPPSTTTATSPHNRTGCCGTAGFEVTDLDCTGSWDEHVFVYLRVDDPNATASTCSDYVLSYHY